MSLDDLGPEIRAQIVTFVDDFRVLASLLRVNHGWRRAAADPAAWLQMGKKFLDGKTLAELNSDPEEWKIESASAPKNTTDLEQGSRRLKLMKYPWIYSFKQKIEAFLEFEKQNKNWRKQKSFLLKYPAVLAIGRALISSGWQFAMYPSLFIFSVLLAVKMDSPGKFSWYSVFAPLWIYQLAVLMTVASFFGMRFVYPLSLDNTYDAFMREPQESDETSNISCNLLFVSLEVLHKTFKGRAIFQIQTLIGILSWIVLCILLPVHLQGDLFVSSSMFLALIIICLLFPLSLVPASFYKCKRYTSWDHGSFDPDVPRFLVIWSIGAFITALLWYSKINNSGIGSFAACLIPLFISQFIAGMSIIISDFDEFRKFISTFFIWVLIILMTIFEALLVVHLDQGKFSFVEAFIPLWIALGPLGLLGLYLLMLLIFNSDLTEQYYGFQ
jgi:hypothetical protein